MNMTAQRDIVLVVEDEPLLRMMAVDMIEEAGFDPVEASDSSHALRILEARRDIRLVFSDIDMPPGIDGLELAAYIRDRWPPINIVLTSGYGQPDSNVLPARCVFYPKPYRPEHVVAALRRFAAA